LHFVKALFRVTVYMLTSAHALA